MNTTPLMIKQATNNWINSDKKKRLDHSKEEDLTSSIDSNDDINLIFRPKTHKMK
jgi:hypothetical protein